MNIGVSSQAVGGECDLFLRSVIVRNKVAVGKLAAGSNPLRERRDF